MFYSRARSTKTRIETTNSNYTMLVSFIIREQDPLKQGLKHSRIVKVKNGYVDSRARSTKTRIETK